MDSTDMLPAIFRVLPSHMGFPSSTAVLSSLMLLWLGWRIWRFTLQPLLTPNTPKTLPYLLPWVGHAVGISRDFGKVFGAGRRKFYRETYSLTVAGQEIYVVTSPADILAIYRESVKLDFESVSQEAMRQFGWTNETLERMCDHHGMAEHGMDLNHKDVKAQLHPGEKFDALQTSFLNHIGHLIDDKKVVNSMVINTSGASKTISLLRWCGYIMVEATIRSFFGNAIFSIYPEVVSEFLDWDREAWKMHVSYPKFAARSMYRAKERAHSALNEYLNLPPQQRADALWLIKRLEERMDGLGVKAKDQHSSLLLAIHRVTSGNAYRHAFWTLAYLLHNEDLLGAVKSETKKAFRPDGSLDMSHLLDECKLLASVCDEALRLSVDSLGLRTVKQELTIGGKTLSPGRVILMPYRQGHFDTQVFGSNPTEFDPYRFLDKKRLQRSTSWRPYGGGSTYCPGRFIQLLTEQISTY